MRLASLCTLTVLLVLAAAAQAAEIAPACRKLPSTAGWTNMGEREAHTLLSTGGPETATDTVVKGFQKGHTEIVFHALKGKKKYWSYWHFNTKTGEQYDTCLDLNGDGKFETYIPKGKTNLEPDLKAWGYQPEKPGTAFSIIRR